MKKAWIENNVIRDIAHGNPSEIYHPDIAAHYSVDVPDDSENGDTFVDGVLTKRPIVVPPPPVPVEPPAPVVPVYEWFIDIGPFYDRFGTMKIPVLSSTDPTIKAIIADLSIRKWVDLKRPDVAAALSYIGGVIPSLTPELRTAILTTPVADVENLALRKLYF